MNSRYACLLSLFVTLVACNVSVPGADGGFDTGDLSGGDPPPPDWDDSLLCDNPCMLEDAECCSENTPARVFCPGTAYPTQVECIAGQCAPAECTTNEDCPFPEMQMCHAIVGRDHCVYPCTDDQQCEINYNMPGTSCVGTTDDGTQFCSQYAEPLE